MRCDNDAQNAPVVPHARTRYVADAQFETSFHITSSARFATGVPPKASAARQPHIVKREGYPRRRHATATSIEYSFSLP